MQKGRERILGPFRVPDPWPGIAETLPGTYVGFAELVFRIPPSP